jgi:hypothetical protein
MELMDLSLDLGDDLHMRALVKDDAALLVEATSGEPAPSLRGPRAAGPYSLLGGRRRCRRGIPLPEASSPPGSCPAGGFSARSG